MVGIMACMKCGGRDLDAVFSHKGAFTGSYQCEKCEHVGPAIEFENWDSYERFRTSLKGKEE